MMTYVDVVDMMNISDHKIGDEGVMAISKALQMNSTLQTIDLMYVMSNSVVK